MTEYWKSNPRHFCEVCKCWFADNKVSIDFHEGGRSHKANVERMLKQTRKKATVKDKEQLELSATLFQIESAAAAAYKKDLAGTSSVTSSSAAADAKSSKKVKQKFKYKQPAQTSSNNKKKEPAITAHIPAPVAEALPLPEGVVPPPPPSPWQQFTSPDSHHYYYNVLTGESQWDEPPGFIPPTAPAHTIATIETPEPVNMNMNIPLPPTHTTDPASPPAPPSPHLAPPSPPPAPPSSGMKHVLTDLTIQLPKGYNTERDGPPSPKRFNPYGSWTTISTRQQVVPEEEESDDETKQEKKVEADNVGQEEEQEDDEEEETIVTPGTFKGFGFNKKPVKKQIFISTKSTSKSTKPQKEEHKTAPIPSVPMVTEKEPPKPFAEDSSDEEEAFVFKEKSMPENPSRDTFQNIGRVGFKKRAAPSKTNIKQRTIDW